jgi:CO/xanthine dehydrogenase FAD-binding subunit
VYSALVAGGTQLVPDLSDTTGEVIDLQDIASLRAIDIEGDRLTLGAMVRLQTIVDDSTMPTLLRNMARREGPNTFRHQGTVGGAIISANGESEFVAALLVHEAVVTIETPAGAHTMPLPDFLANVESSLRSGILTSVAVATSGKGADARVARTPADSPIVAAIARRDSAGALHLALCGVAPTPILVAADAQPETGPPDDFRGSSEYRAEMARILTERVLRELG